MGLWNVTSSKTDNRGLKTTISVTTEDEKVIEALLEEPEASEPKKQAREAKTSNKKESPKKALPSPAKTNKNFQSTGKKKEVKKNDIPTYKPAQPKKLEPVKKNSAKELSAPKKASRASLKRDKVTGTGVIVHNTRNLSEQQIGMANHNSMFSARGNSLKKEYEAYRHKIEFSGLSNKQKDKLLDKLYKLYAPILKYDSQWYSPMVSGPARYPQAKMDKIYEMKMNATSTFLDWWKSIESQLDASTKSKKVLASEAEKLKKEKIESIKKSFDSYYKKLVNDVLPKLKAEGKEKQLKYYMDATLAMHYVNQALKVDTNLYKELFEKLNKICNFNKNSNDYKGYKLVMEGKLSSESIQKQAEENNKVIFTCSEYEIKNLKIDAGKRIAIKFLFYPKPQLVYALKKRGYTWYSFKECFICKPEKFDLEWAKGIKNQYEKYL